MLFHFQSYYVISKSTEWIFSKGRSFLPEGAFLVGERGVPFDEKERPFFSSISSQISKSLLYPSNQYRDEKLLLLYQ